MTSLIFDNVSKHYQDGENINKVIDQMSFKLGGGKMVAVIGPSGSGKSTFLSMAGALLTPTDGTIYINNQKISGLSQKELTLIRQEHIGFIFQGSQLVSYLTVLEQLMVISDFANNDKDDSKKLALSLIKNLGLEHRKSAYPEELSGGEKQRVAIARAFMNDPSLILADEPTANLDFERGYQVVKMMREEIQRRQKDAIIVTHDTRLLDLMDHVYQMKDGKLISYQSI